MRTTIKFALYQCCVSASEPPKKKIKHSDDVLDRLIKVEKYIQDTVSQLKENVRMLATYSNLNYALLLLTLEEFARTVRRQKCPEADTYMEVSRRSHKHQGSINLSSLGLVL